MYVYFKTRVPQDQAESGDEMRKSHLGILKDGLCPYHQCPSLGFMCLASVAPLAPSSRMEVGPSIFFSHEALNLGLDKPSLQTLGTFLLR